MSQRTIARRYATALYEEAENLDIVDTVDDDIELLRASLSDSDELHRFFQNPVISDEKKQNVVKALFGERTHDLTQRFLGLLIKKDREGMVSAIADQYHDLRNEQRGIVEATVKAAHDLDEEVQSSLKDALESATGKRVVLHLEQDESLIGGVVVRVGDRVFDGSVRNKLDSLRERFRTSRVEATENGSA
jgi:F-type H+-transporting ATPase subunit delta